MSELCRICMIPRHDLIDLAKEGTEKLERSGEKFEDCFGVKVAELPYCQRICKGCDKQLIDFYYFKQLALRTHNYLIDKAADVQAKCTDIKEEVDEDYDVVPVKGNSPVEFFNIEYLDEDEEAVNAAPLGFMKKERGEDVVVKQEKYEDEYPENTASEVLDGYEQIESLMDEDQDTSESISENRVEGDGLANNDISETEEKQTNEIHRLHQMRQKSIRLESSWKKSRRENSQDENYTPENIKNNRKRKKKKLLKEVKHRCEICKKPFRTEETLNAHFRSVHQGLPRYSCDLCDKTFKERNKFEYHMKNHRGERNWKCSICDKGFLIEWDLELHMRTHTDYRPHICELCGRAFKVYCHLTEHRETHNETNVFECRICQARLHTSKTLRGHMASAHKIGNIQHCKICNRTFVRGNRLKLHMNKYHPSDYLEANLEENFNVTLLEI